MKAHRNPDGSEVQVPDSARIGSDARIEHRHHVAHFGPVGSGHCMTLYRTLRDGKVGWELTAGCETFTADTVDAVLGMVRHNVRDGGAHVRQWADRSERELWSAQVLATLVLFALSVSEDPR